MIPVPQRWHLLTAFVILAFMVIGFTFLNDYGMGWDEVTRWNSGDLKVDYYLGLLDGSQSVSSQKMSGDRYPGLFDITLSATHRLIGGNRMWMGHALSLLFATIGLISTAWLANTLFGGRTAFLSTLFLVSFPNFYGHAMINPKDIPFMAMYTLGLGALVRVTQKVWRSGRIKVLDAFLTGLMIGLAAGCRVPGMVLLGFAGFAWAFSLIWGIQNKKHPFSPQKLAINYFGTMAVCGTSALLVLFAFFPRLHVQLFSGLANVSSALHSSASAIPLLYNGQVMDAGEGPATYAFGFLLISTPIWLLVLMGLGFVLALFRLKPAYSQEPEVFQKLVLILLFAVFPWIYVLVSHPALHNGIRHMLWAIPPLIMVAGFGYESILVWVTENYKKWQWIPSAGIAMILLIQAFQLYRSHPYQYVYFNFLAGDHSTVINRFEGEYWFTSTQHLLEKLPSVVEKPINPENPIKIRVSGPLNCAIPFVPKGFSLVDTFEEADYYVSNTTFRSDLFAEGDVVYQITSNGIPIGVIKRLTK